jgi:hypothetical protein
MSDCSPLLALAAGALAGAVLLLFHPNTSAYHPTIYGSYGYHLNSIHSVSAYEDFCVWVRDGSIAHSEALGRIRRPYILTIRVRTGTAWLTTMYTFGLGTTRALPIPPTNGF